MLGIYIFFTGLLRFTKLLWAKFIFLHVFNISIGKNPYIGLKIRANHYNAITLGDNCVISDNARMWCELPTGYLTAGDNFQLNRSALIDFTGGVTIGNNVLISEGAVIYTHSHGYDPHSKPIGNELIIEDNVWIGHSAIILQGVTRIGKNTIIGAGSVVSKNIEDNCVYVNQNGRLLQRKDFTFS